MSEGILFLLFIFSVVASFLLGICFGCFTVWSLDIKSAKEMGEWLEKEGE